MRRALVRSSFAFFFVGRQAFPIFRTSFVPLFRSSDFSVLVSFLSSVRSSSRSPIGRQRGSATHIALSVFCLFMVVLVFSYVEAGRWTLHGRGTLDAAMDAHGRWTAKAKIQEQKP